MINNTKILPVVKIEFTVSVNAKIIVSPVIFEKVMCHMTRELEFGLFLFPLKRNTWNYTCCPAQQGTTGKNVGKRLTLERYLLVGRVKKFFFKKQNTRPTRRVHKIKR